MSMEKTELKETVLKALKMMNNEELCEILNRFFQRLGTFDSVNSMTLFTLDDVFYAYDAEQDTISSFNWVKESNFFKDNVDNVIDEVVENWDALGSPTLTRILEGASR